MGRSVALASRPVIQGIVKPPREPRPPARPTARPEAEGNASPAVPIITGKTPPRKAPTRVIASSGVVIQPAPKATVTTTAAQAQSETVPGPTGRGLRPIRRRPISRPPQKALIDRAPRLASSASTLVA